MDADFPAAHSMDTTFFAVDAAGHVAVFDSGEPGPALEGARDQDLFDLLSQIPGIPPEQADPESVGWEEVFESVHQLGLFYYEAENEPLPLQPRYERLGTPEHPLHVDQLPPEARKLVKQYILEDLRFAESELIQLLDHLDCQVWSSYAAAYLCADGQTVKPLPGEEEGFASFAEELCRDYPEDTAQLDFEGIQQPKRTKRSRKRKKPEEWE